MDKTGITLDQLERVEEPFAQHLRDLYPKPMAPKDSDESHTHLYKCPCGKGHVVDGQCAIPGHEAHDAYIACDVCREKYKIVK